MIIKHPLLGECQLEIQVEHSVVDSFITQGYSLTLDRELSDLELDNLRDEYGGEIDMYCMEWGSRETD